MDRTELNEILELHKKWLNKERGGKRADLSGMDLSGMDFYKVDLTRANLSGANLQNADLTKVNLRYAILSGANLNNALLYQANLENATLENADLSHAILNSASLRDALLVDANLKYAELVMADLGYAKLQNADLTHAVLGSAMLNGANLSKAKGLMLASDYLEQNFERTSEGYIAYKTFNDEYASPKNWIIEPGSVITENVDYDRCRTCGYGINVAPLEWVKKHYKKSTIWKVLIRFEWLAGVCVPYDTDGKVRCEKVELLEIVK